MSNFTKRIEECLDNEIFEDSTFLANFENSGFKDTSSSKFNDSLVNKSSDKSAFNASALCCDEELSGYDKLTGRTWIYPTNYPVRDYQFNIIKAALLKNTLVSLPTGLGKTFIAAVIMYNFYRWYPTGKIVFTAPTRPLVAQQIDACYNIIAIPPNDTIEMTGHMQATTRKAHWKNKRVFFATPQVIYNDIKSGICPGDKIRCLVIDEAHRARGNYAYCQIVATLNDIGHKLYRMLALSATPGSKVDDVINVVRTLLIAHLELRTECCIDVSPYSHSRKINTVIVPLGPELSQLRQQYVEILDDYARRLKQLNILPHNLGNLSKGRIVMLYKEYQCKERGARHAQHNFIMKDFTLLIALYHGLELLVKHGSRVFLNFFDEHPEKSWIQSDDRLTALLERLRDDLGINPLSLDRSILPDGTVPEIPQNLSFGHPKFYKLKEIMLDHFNSCKQKGQDTRAIVFCEYRESVNLVHCLLLQCRPLITPQMFVGQGASGKEGKAVVSQKQQLRVMRLFRAGACNVLVATCVAEEGLDVGSVDLILCFDISSRSPVRLVQRCGRTGRERGGQVHILVTEGREHQTLMDCMRQRDGLTKKILNSKDVENNLYKNNPRMVPRDFTPACQKMYITVAKKEDKKDKETIDKTKKGQKDLRSMLFGRASSSGSSSSNKETDSLITNEEFKEIFPFGFHVDKKFAKPKEYWSMDKGSFRQSITGTNENTVNLSTWLEWQRSLQNTVNIGHSKDSEILSSLLQYSDARRFDLPPSTQNPIFSTQEMATQNIMITTPTKTKQPAKKKVTKTPLKKIITAKSPGKKDGDIRALFSTATKSTKSYTKLITDLGLQNDGSIPTRLVNLFIDLNVNCTEESSTCAICVNLIDCNVVKTLREKKDSRQSFPFLNDLKLPDLDLIDDFDEETIINCRKTSTSLVNDLDTSGDPGDAVSKMHCSGNFDLEFDFDSPMISPTNAPKTENLDENLDSNFDIGDLEDIFVDSSPEILSEVKTDKVVEKNESNPKEALRFFGIESIDDIFADDESVDLHQNQIKDRVQTPSKSSLNLETRNKSPILECPTSPSILSGRTKANTNISPILCSQGRKFSLTMKNSQAHASTPASHTKKQLFKEPTNINIPLASEKSMQQKNNRNSLSDTNKSMFTITQLVDLINNTDEDTSMVVKSSTSKLDGNSPVVVNKSLSPIILTQAERQRNSKSVNESFKCKFDQPTQSRKSESLIILDSDSDSDDTQVYDVIDNSPKCEPISVGEEYFKSPVNMKRKHDSDEDQSVSSSPYFNKKPKLDSNATKQLTLQEKVLKALSSNKTQIEKSPEKKSQINFMFSSPDSFISLKENQNPEYDDFSIGEKKEEYVRKNNLEMLQMFRKDSKIVSPKKKLQAFLNSPVKRQVKTQNKILTFDDSDSDFVEDDGNKKPNGDNVATKERNTSLTKTQRQKVRKRKKNNSFLELEAELSGSGSGDELSDESVGSIVDFICDDDSKHEDIHAVYLKSVKSPVNGVFKIPQLPNKYDREDVFSQFVAEDTYEMDSFCVDSHIGLTQANEVSELELAEILLERKRKSKKSKKKPIVQDNDVTLVIKRKAVKRQIQSDSDDSS